MRFTDFELRAWQLDESHAQVIVHNSPAGQMRKPETVPLDTERLSDGCWIFDQPRWYLGPVVGQHLVKLGQDLADILLPDPVYGLLNRCLERLDDDEGLRLRLCLDPTLVDLPWEYLWRPDVLHDKQGGPLIGFLCVDSRISLVREPATTSVRTSTRVRQPRLVFAGMLCSDGRPDWRVEEEYEELCKTLQPAREWVTADLVTATDAELTIALQRQAFIFHYVGITHVEEGSGYLVREVRGRQPVNPVFASGPDPQTADYDRLFSPALGLMLQRANTRLALFSAPNSGRWPFVEPLILGGIPAIIGVRGLTSSNALAAFCEKLYSSLAAGLSLDEAVTFARNTVLLVAHESGRPNYEWGAFMVYMPAMEAVLIPRPRKAHERQEAIRQEREQTVETVEQSIGKAPGPEQAIDRTALRKAMAAKLSQDDLAALCADVQQDLEKQGIELRVDPATVGGENKLRTVLNLIAYLYTHGHLNYLVDRLRRDQDFAAVVAEYEKLAEAAQK
jgi:hypothetical protein